MRVKPDYRAMTMSVVLYSLMGMAAAKAGTTMTAGQAASFACSGSGSGSLIPLCGETANSSSTNPLLPSVSTSPSSSRSSASSQPKQLCHFEECGMLSPGETRKQFYRKLEKQNHCVFATAPTASGIAAPVTGATTSTSSNSCKLASQYKSVSNYYISTFLPSKEGFIHHCYAPGDGTCTAGIGHVIGSAPCPKYCQAKGYYSNSTIQRWVSSDLNSANGAESCVRTNVKVPISQAQFDALTDIVYNMGCGGATNYGIWNSLNLGNYSELYKLIENRYKLAQKEFWPGLKKRASEEASVFNNTSPKTCIQVNPSQAGI